MSEQSQEQEQEQEQDQDFNEAIKEAFEEGLNAEYDEDSVKMAMIQAGATFKNVTRLYNQLLIDAGLAISNTDRAQIVAETLKDADISTEEGFDTAAAKLVGLVTGATERSAHSLIRAYAKKNEKAVFIKPKVEGGARNPFITLFHTSLVENPAMTEDELKALIDSLENKHQVNPLRWFNQHNGIRNMANEIAAKYTS
jgi:hypothetical protein